MYKKFIISVLCLASAWSAFAAHEPIPYENVIAREYNRTRSGADRYSSIHTIMNQTLRGKSPEQKNQIIADLKSLKHAVHAALEQAKHDGKRMWYWGYIWKDNEPAIQTLAQYSYDIDDALRAAELQMQSDLVRLLWYISGVTGGALAGITALYLSQHYLSQQNYLRNGHHGLLEMVGAPVQAGLDVASVGAKYILAAIVLGAEGVKQTAGAGLQGLQGTPASTHPA